MHTHQLAAAIDERSWNVLVEATLPVVWSTMRQWALPDDDMEWLCQLVFLRLLEEITATNRGMPEQRTVSGVLRAITVEECERAHRLALWRATGDQGSPHVAALRHAACEGRA